MIMDALTSPTSVSCAETFDIEAGWSRLAAGERGLRAPGDTAADRVFNQIASQLEASTVDLSAEFTGLITTQRAYSASSKIITTADEMLAELINIKR